MAGFGQQQQQFQTVPNMGGNPMGGMNMGGMQMNMQPSNVSNLRF